MRSQRRGRIVNMSSMGGRLTFPVGGFYHASKHALEALSDALRWEVAQFGVHVILLEPGPVRSSFGRTGIETLANSREDSPYADLVKSAGDALRSTFEGSASEQACSPDRVARRASER